MNTHEWYKKDTFLKNSTSSALLIPQHFNKKWNNSINVLISIKIDDFIK